MNKSDVLTPSAFSEQHWIS